MPAVKIWKTRPAHFVLLEVLSKKGDMVDDDLFNQLTISPADIRKHDLRFLYQPVEKLICELRGRLYPVG